MYCSGAFTVISVTDSEHVTSIAPVTTRLLNPGLKSITFSDCAQALFNVRVKSAARNVDVKCLFIFFLQLIQQYDVDFLKTLSLASGYYLKILVNSRLYMPKVMGILNVTPDSFFSGSRIQDADSLAARVEQICREGAHAIDIGACSTRPGAQPVSSDLEKERLAWALPVVREVNQGRCLISVDTFRPEIAEWCIREIGADMINDVSGGSEKMYRMVAETGVLYVLTAADSIPDGTDVISAELSFFRSRLGMLGDCGVQVAEQVILDPGFGFGKTLDGNWMLLSEMDSLRTLELPVLVGVSRKSMAWKLLDITPDDCLPATIAMNMAALERGAEWIRVHDVKEGVETVRIFEKLQYIS